MATPKQIPDVILPLANKLLEYLNVKARRENTYGMTSQDKAECDIENPPPKPMPQFHRTEI